MPVREINIVDELPRAEALLRANWAETGFDFELDVDAQRYAQLQQLGVMFAFGAFVGDDLVGYATAVVVPHLFNRQVLVCHTDAMFMAPEHRASILPGRLMQAVEGEAARRGARLVMWHARAGTGLADMLRHRGYTEADTLMMKGLDHGS